ADDAVDQAAAHVDEHQRDAEENEQGGDRPAGVESTSRAREGQPTGAGKSVRVVVQAVAPPPGGDDPRRFAVVHFPGSSQSANGRASQSNRAAPAQSSVGGRRRAGPSRDGLDDEPGSDRQGLAYPTRLEAEAPT